MESSSSHMASLLKIESPTSGWVKSLENLLNTINDVDFTIDKRSKTVYVYGKINPEIILQKITKAGIKAEIVWSDDYGCKNPLENQRDRSMKQCYSSGYINAPNGYSNYHHHHQQQCNGPPPNRMYQPQTHNQTSALPPPYIRQLHPQPPPPYVFHQNEPVAKGFPPTPAPPKNFTMGDLQPGCRVM